MSNKILVIVIHGIGSQKANFADNCIKSLNKKIELEGKDHRDIVWLPVYWAQFTEVAQLAYFEAAKASADLDYLSLRKFVLTALGDASAYQKTTSGTNRTYDIIHGFIDSKISDALNNPHNGIGPDSPVVLLAHSLGGHIMSNYIWDKQYAPDASKSALENMETLCGMMTFGCNIPLFTFAYTPIKPIQFPPTSLNPDLVAKSKWLNFYDSDDVLGYPLKCINPDYGSVVDQDIPINVGSILTSWNPACHTAYWTDKDFINPVAKFISSIL